jgi:peptide-methionine (S)-S-oxide reductase
LELFFRSHNARVSSFSRQYRSAIFYHSEEQRSLAEDAKRKLETEGRIHTSIEPFRAFYLAEDYHQKYYLRSAGLLMAELEGRYSGQEQFVDSTVVARLNGYVGGFGTLEEMEADLPTFGLSSQAEQYLRRRVARR